MLAIIPARGKSKGLPGKNIRDLNGKPLIAYTIEAALNSKEVTNVIVSTDDPFIYETALTYGTKETFLRPSYLAEDDSLAIDTYLYTIDRINKEFGEKITEFVVLQPTSPLRNSYDIDTALNLFSSKKADSVISYTEEAHPIFWHKYIDKHGNFENIFPDILQNRQASRPTYYPNGAIGVFNFELIKQRHYYSKKSYPYLMPKSRSVDIDSLDDFLFAEYLMKSK